MQKAPTIGEGLRELLFQLSRFNFAHKHTHIWFLRTLGSVVPLTRPAKPLILVHAVDEMPPLAMRTFRMALRHLRADLLGPAPFAITPLKAVGVHGDTVKRVTLRTRRQALLTTTTLSIRLTRLAHPLAHSPIWSTSNAILDHTIHEKRVS